MRWLMPALALALALALGVMMWPTVVPIADRPVTLPQKPLLRITALGTSLTANYDWPNGLVNTLAECGQAVTVTKVALAGASSDWGRRQVAAVLQTTPDVVLVEFSINDADLLDGISLHQSAQNHRALIADLRQGNPDLAIILMTMSPAQGPRGWVRPRLARFYALYAELAAELDLGLVDFYPRWMSLPRSDRGLTADGLHPEMSLAAAMIVPVLGQYLRPTCMPTNPAG